MIMKVTKIERWAGIFLGSTIIGFIALSVVLSVKQGWFEKTRTYHSTFSNADGVHRGTLVQMSGLKIGEVMDVELLDQNKILVKYSVKEQYSLKIKDDSVAQLLRPFVIGERVLDITIGQSEDLPLLSDSEIHVKESLDIMSFLSGKGLGESLDSFQETFKNLGHMLKTLSDQKRTKSLVKIFDRLDPLLVKMDIMATQMTGLGRQLNDGDKLKDLVSNMTQLSSDFQGLGTLMKKMGPELPETTKRAVEALNETVVVLKALQQSFLLKSNVEKVRREEAERKPASQSAP